MPLRNNRLFLKIQKFTQQKQFQFFVYKVLHDVAFLLLFVFAGMLIAEGIIPGFLSAHLSLTKLILAMLFCLLAIAYLGSKLDLSYPKISIRKSKSMPFVLLFSMLLFGNSMLKFTFWQNIIITLGLLVLFFLFYRIIFFSDKE